MRAVGKISLTGWILAAMLAGVMLGLAAPEFSAKLAPVSTIFLRLVRSIIAPLLFGTLVWGIAGAGSLKAVGRIGLKSVIYFEIVTTLALVVGLAAVNLAKPGRGLELRAAEQPVRAATPSATSFLEHIVPASVVDAMARGEILQLVIFSLLFGAACSAVGEKARPVVEFARSLAEVMFKYTGYVMWLAPAGVCAAVAVTVAGHGPGVLAGLGKLIVTMYAAQAVFLLGVLGPVILIFKIPLRRFWRAVKEPFLIAFSTASSEAALPKALENTEKFGVPAHIAGFVIPTGYSFNLDGSTLYLSLATVFVAQAAGIELSFERQLLIMLMLMLTSKGVAGVPRAALVILTGMLSQFGLPVEGAALLLGIDAILDMARTSVNVAGNCLAAAVVARWEGIQFDSGTPARSGP